MRKRMEALQGTRRIGLIVWSLLLITFTGLAQTDLQSVRSSGNDRLLIHEEAMIWMDLDSSMQYFEKVINESSRNGDQITEADHCILMSKAHNFRRNCDEMEKWLQRAEAIYIRTDDQRGLAEVLYQKAYASFCRLDYEQALEYILEGLAIMESLEDQAGIALGYLRMSRIFHFTFKLEQSADYGRRGGELYDEVGDRINAADAWSFAGHAYRMMGQNDQMMESFNRSLKLARETRIPAVLSMAYNDMATQYSVLDLPDSSIIYFENALGVTDPEDIRQIMVIKNGLGQLYLATERYQDCIDLLSEAMITVWSTNDIFFLSELPEYIAQSYAALGQYDSAYKYMELNWRYSDSLFTQEQDAALEEMETKYETEKKEEVIAQQKREQIYALILLGIILAVAFLIYRAYLNKKKLNALLEERNEEKDFLLKEIHHRVKNNLQILSSLLSLQSDHTDDASAIYVLEEGRNRVEAMGLIHQRLYTNENVTGVNMNEYLGEMCGHLESSFFSRDQEITIDSKVHVDMMDVDTAVPLGLIVNELITNAAKYAFEPGDKGTIHVKLWINDSKNLCLEVNDDGQGKKSEKSTKSTSFGSKLIQILSKKLKGEIQTSLDQGYKTNIEFKRFKLVNQ